VSRHRPVNIRDLLESQAARLPDKPFLFGHQEHSVLTYREFDEAVNRTANLLLSLGAGPGERVSLLLTNSVVYLVFYFACFKTGAWAGPVNALLKSKEIEFVISDSQSTVVVTQEDLYGHFAQAKENLPLIRNVVVVDSPADEEELNSEHEPSYTKLVEAQSADLREIAIAGDDEALIIYTSGTTGKPKGVLLTHQNLLVNAREIAEWLRLTESDRSLMIMPLFHVNALMTTAMAALWAGGSVVLARRFSASQHWQMVSDYGVTYFGSVATMLSLLNHAYPDGVPEGCDISTLRFALCGSAPVPVEVMRQFESLFRCPATRLNRSAHRERSQDLRRRRR
jgi:long-chain acyl-CoA synthetase